MRAIVTQICVFLDKEEMNELNGKNSIIDNLIEDDLNRKNKSNDNILIFIGNQESQYICNDLIHNDNNNETVKELLNVIKNNFDID